SVHIGPPVRAGDDARITPESNAAASAASGRGNQRTRGASSRARGRRRSAIQPAPHAITAPARASGTTGDRRAPPAPVLGRPAIVRPVAASLTAPLGVTRSTLALPAT